MTRLLLILAAIVLLLGGAVWCFFLRSSQPAMPPAGTASLDSPWWGEGDRLVEVDGVTARVRVEGPEDAPVLVLIHGFSHSLETWDAWAAALAGDYRIVRMDLPGHGLTGPDPQQRYSVPETVTFVSDLMAALNIRRATLVGNSLGGLVAWRLAADEPERVERLVLLSPGGFSINGVTEQPVDVPMAIRFYFTQAPRPAVSAASHRLFGDAARMPEGHVDRVHAMMTQPGIGDALVQRLEVFTLPDPEADLARVGQPTLILWGEADAMVPADHADRFVAAMPDAQLVMLEGVGHMPQEEVPADSLSVLQDFLDET